MVRITDEYVINQRSQSPNIDTSHRCVFRCPQCTRQKIISQDQIRRSFDLSEESFQKILDFYNNSVSFCGQISDPIYHPSFLNLLRMCDTQQVEATISTVGSGKSDAWWDEAYSYGIGDGYGSGLNTWIFGIDGIDKKSEIYRVGSDFEDAWKRMIQGRDSGHLVVWQYIIFGYNEHEIDRAIEIAKDEDISLMFIATNRNFNTANPALRKSVKFDITKPSGKEYTSEVSKSSWWGFRSSELNLHKSKRRG